MLVNGLTVIIEEGRGKGYNVSLTVPVGHLSAPMGLAKLYEQTVTKGTDISVFFGGTITSYSDVCGPSTKELKNSLKKIADMIKFRDFSQAVIHRVAQAIAEENTQMAVMRERLLKLRYKHTAFPGVEVWDPEKYNRLVTSYTVADLVGFVDRYMTGRNIVLSITGRNVERDLLDIVERVKELFGEGIPAGTKATVENQLYTGGFARIDCASPFTGIMLGWDVSGVALTEVPELNVLMSLMSRRLEFELSPLGVNVSVKIAGYYGFRTLRIFLSGGDIRPKEIIDVVVKFVRTLRTKDLLSEVELAKNNAMARKLAASSQPETEAVELALRYLGRGGVFDVNDHLYATGNITTRDIRERANDIFRSKLTYVVCAKPEAEFYTYDEMLSMLEG